MELEANGSKGKGGKQRLRENGVRLEENIFENDSQPLHDFLGM